MDILKAFKIGGFAGLGAAVGENLKKDGSLNSLSDVTHNQIFSSGTSAPGPFTPSLSTKVLITIGAVILGLSIVKKVV